MTASENQTLLPHTVPRSTCRDRVSEVASYRGPGAAANAARAFRGLAHAMPTFMLGCLVVGCSAGLINFNKYLLQPGRFPFPIALVILHTFFASICCCFLLPLKPAWFPSLTDSAKKVSIDKSFLATRVVPVAAFFTGQLVLSNMAFKYASVPFLQMMKEGNVIIVYLLSLVVALEVWNVRQATLLLFIFGATLISLRGEVHLSVAGVAIQGASCLCESGKIIMQGVLLTGAGRKLDALSYVLVVSPVCFALLSALAITILSFPSATLALPEIQFPRWSDIEACRSLLAINVIIAVTLNVGIAAFIKLSSPLAFVIVGLAKDAMIVLASAVVLREPVSSMQAFGFTLQLLLISLWSVMKCLPEHFEDGIIIGLQRVVAGDKKLLL